MSICKQWKDIENKGQIANHNVDVIYGYIRLNYAPRYETNVFPVDIIKLIIFFYQDGINWKLNRNEVQLLNTAKNKYDKILSHPIIINDIIFNYVIYPRYRDSQSFNAYAWARDNGDVWFGLELQSMPTNIEYMTIYFELRCIETNNSFKTTHTFGSHQASGSVINFVKNEDIANRKYDTITFQGCLDILCIKYRGNHRLNLDQRFMDLTKMDRICEYQWKIEKEIIKSKLEQFQKIIKKHSIGEWRIYSPSNFNHNAFGLCLSNCQEVNGTNAISYHHLLMGIRMFRIPANVKKLDIEYQCNIGDKKYLRSRIVKCGSEQIMKFCAFNKKMSLIKDVNVKVQIEIVDAFDYNDTKINEDQWSKYGII